MTILVRLCCALLHYSLECFVLEHTVVTEHRPGRGQFVILSLDYVVIENVLCSNGRVIC